MRLIDFTQTRPIIAGAIKRLPGDRIAPAVDVLAAYTQGIQDWGLLPQNFIIAKQVHGSDVRVVVRGDGGIVDTVITQQLECDGLVTREIGLGVGIVTADCLPVLFFDEDATVVAAAHAGWRGLADSVLAATVKDMGVLPEKLHAYIGAAICQNCFEVGPEVAAAFAEKHYIKGGRDDRLHIDLKGIATEQLQAQGVKYITVSPDCTCCLPGVYWSHRKHSWQRGNQLTFICLSS
ncbi:MAG: peptidoglycan editing factor PgeF [Oscillospiraceae bacterium]|nr:peptidoglycan editing factor PgeF [Oscillospiraceae bacterium]